MVRIASHKPHLRLLNKLRSRMVRLGHSRGHGVHSPYIYGIVREVFMRRRLISGSHGELVGELERCGVGRRTVVELQNIYTHCGYDSYCIDGSEAEMADLMICTPNVSIDGIARLYDESTISGSTIVVLNHTRSAEVESVCRGIVLRHRSTVVDRGRYLIIFNNHLPKQYFQL